MENNIPEGMKKCSKCGEIKPATAEYFNKNGRGGMRSMCRVCSHEYHRKHYQKNKDRKLEYCQKNKDRKHEYNREYYQKNKDRIRECCREYYQKNKDRRLEYVRAPVGRLVQSIYRLRRKTGATIYLRDMTDEQKEALANQYVAVKTLEKTEKELLAASGKKRCSKCGGFFDFDMFHKAGGGMRSDCKACANERGRKYRQKQKKALDKIESIPDNRE